MSSHPVPRRDYLKPYGITGEFVTIFGLNWDGSNDEDDVDRHGHNLRGAWGDETHNEEALGISLPTKVLRLTFGSSRKPAATAVIHSLKTEKTIEGVPIIDRGPAARLHRAADLTWRVHKELGHIDLIDLKNRRSWPVGFPVAFCLIDPKTKHPVKIKGWDFVNRKVVGS